MMSSSKLILKKAFIVRSNETDISGYMRPGALTNCLIQAAVDSADQLGFGLASLRDQECFWVLSRLVIELRRPIKWREKIVVETWPKDVDGLHYLRDFRIMDSEGVEIGAGLSAWLLVNAQSKRPKHIEAGHREVFCELRNLNAGDRKLLNRIVLPSEPPDDRQMRESSYFDFDLNGHVTTTRYIDWMMDTFNFDWHCEHYLSSLRVNFIREILPYDGVSLSSWIHDSDYYFSGESILNQRPSFSAHIRFSDYA